LNGILNLFILRVKIVHLPYLYGISFLLCIFAGLLGGCAGLQKSEMQSLQENVPSRYELETVPFYPQAAYQCGPATLAMALTWSGLSITPEALKDQVYTPSRKGSLQMAMIAAARRHGRIAYEIPGLDSIFPEIAAGHPVIVLQNLGLSWFPVWHYALVVGYDFSKGVVVLRSGVTARKVTPFHTFQNTWSHSNYWGLLVLEPSQIPALAKENSYLAAVLGLEKSRQFQPAIVGYQTALSRWPQSLPAMMGLGNSYYAAGDLTEAEAAFRKAIQRHPQAGSAFNNLAQVLLEQDRKYEALEAAQKAVSMGGPMSSVFQETLQEVKSKMP
jgi:hypothetical protein